MYDGKAGVEVYVKPNHTNTAYREYEAPRSSPLYTGYGNERYIEAVSVEDNDLTVEQEEDEALKRGKIRVTVHLGQRKWLDGKLKYIPNYSLPRETSKKVAIDRGRSHGVASVHDALHALTRLFPADRLFSAIPVDFEAGDENEKNFTWIPAQGYAGKGVTFTFFYASRMILELKQIIPTTATPPDQGTEGEQTDNDQGTKSRNKAVAPPITTTGSKFEKRPKQIISLDSDDEQPPPPKKIKREVTEGIASTEAASKSPATSTAKSSKDRERTRIESRLEDIRLQREENRLRRQMMDLEDGE
ncbi:hypothetical protein D0863_10071 [Hortaea werneckii]|uniref:Uncharacterized protein n=1 Tax=Hortaea werneckii TaxID=91943 RepID=A0A3M7DIB2_HORWE|nr:hypothetical protein D0863_10071 [Hortaea werneckii]